VLSLCYNGFMSGSTYEKMKDSMNVDAYLQRIGYTGSRAATATTLRDLQVAHMQSVPFENLDIHLGRPLDLALPALFDKIVVRRRGGFCYEVNGLFAWLLRSLGFEVTHLSARVGNGGASGQEFGPEFDHLTLQVRCPQDADPAQSWLADVGFGDSFVHPLRLEVGTEQLQGLRAYRIDAEGPYRFLWRRNYDGAWTCQHRFTLQPRRFAAPDGSSNGNEFAAMCLYHQRSPDSHFPRKRICSRATPQGRISLDDERLIITTDGMREERPVADEAEYRALLWEHFGIDLDQTPEQP
jgi:N-hydroxyarylamine O-acetyltransferase